ncbi:MAG: hypothetical protein CMO01_13695 [Thalassobius sp.]|nr:hypothetical protein [Thalassovita sp.]
MFNYHCISTSLYRCSSNNNIAKADQEFYVNSDERKGTRLMSEISSNQTFRSPSFINTLIGTLENKAYNNVEQDFFSFSLTSSFRDKYGNSTINRISETK